MENAFPLSESDNDTLCLFQDISEYKCESGKSPLYVPHKPVTGVIGASFSGVSIMVANILRLFKVNDNFSTNFLESFIFTLW